MLQSPLYARLRGTIHPSGFHGYKVHFLSLFRYLQLWEQRWKWKMLDGLVSGSVCLGFYFDSSGSFILNHIMGRFPQEAKLKKHKNMLVLRSQLFNSEEIFSGKRTVRPWMKSERWKSSPSTLLSAPSLEEHGEISAGTALPLNPSLRNVLPRFRFPLQIAEEKKNPFWERRNIRAMKTCWNLGRTKKCSRFVVSPFGYSLKPAD